VADFKGQCLARHAQRYSSCGRKLPLPSPMNDMALTETCKLIFNIVHFYPDLSETFSKAIPSLLKILHKTKIPSPPLQQPVGALINALLNLDLSDGKKKGLGYSALFPKIEPKGNAEHLINILDAAISSYPEGELDQAAAPVVTLVRKVYEVAPDNVKKFMEWLLLPTDAERNKPLGKSDTLSARLLRLSTSAMTPNLRTSISAMMFELSGSDSNKFVRNVGYGFAAGFLMSQNMPIPENANEAFSNGDGADINPITGQRRDKEPEDTGPKMTDEEKEREAERLFVLFERCVLPLYYDSCPD
jgi:Guanine nucleotide exchange factor synembryn